MIKHSRLLVVLLALSIALIAAIPVFADQNATLGPIVFDPAACTLSVTFTVEDEGNYAVTVYDDGVLILGYEQVYAAGSIVQVVFTIGGPDASPGVAVGIRESLASPTAYTFVNAVFWTDPEGDDCQSRSFVFGFLSVTILNEEAAAGALPPCPNPLPADAVIRSVPAGALAYFEPSYDAYTGFNLPPGTWYTTDTDGEFTQVWIACQASSIWIPTANIAG